MRTRTLPSLLSAMALLAAMSVTSADLPATPGAVSTPTPPPTVTNAAPRLPTAAVEVQPPETAAVQVLAAPDPLALPNRLSLSGWAAELVKLASAGIGEEVLLSFVDSAGTFNLGADQIIYLHDIGVPSQVITTAIQHDAEIFAGLRQVTAGAPPGPSSSFYVSLPPAKPEPAPATTTSETLPERSEFAGYDPLYLAGWFDDADEWGMPNQKPELYPVRKPYAVQLTAPIIVVRAQGRMPNMTILRTFH